MKVVRTVLGIKVALAKVVDKKEEIILIESNVVDILVDNSLKKKKGKKILPKNKKSKKCQETNNCSEIGRTNVEIKTRCTGNEKRPLTW